jgi:hypothetical protein
MIADFGDYAAQERMFLKAVCGFKQSIDKKSGMINRIFGNVICDSVDVVQGAWRPDHLCHFFILSLAASSETPFPALISRSPRSNFVATYKAWMTSSIETLFGKPSITCFAAVFAFMMTFSFFESWNQNTKWEHQLFNH